MFSVQRRILIMETPNVNNLNGVPNFGHGFPEVEPEDNNLNEQTMDNEEVKEAETDVPAPETEAEEDNG